MPSRVTAPAATIDEPADDTQALTASIHVRGKEYRFRELLTEEYDKLVKMAADEDDIVDRTLLLRLMVVEASVEPKLTPEGLAKLPYPIARRLNVLINDMHYSNDEPQAAEDEGKPKRPNR